MILVTLQKLKRIHLIYLLFALPITANAASGGTYFIGPEAGFALLNAGAGAHPDFGLTAGMKLTLPVYVAAFYTYIPFGSVSSPNSVSVSGSEKFFGAQVSYDFTPAVTGLSFGARVGFSSISTQAVTPSTGEVDQS